MRASDAKIIIRKNHMYINCFKLYQRGSFKYILYIYIDEVKTGFAICSIFLLLHTPNYAVHIYSVCSCFGAPGNFAIASNSLVMPLNLLNSFPAFSSIFCCDFRQKLLTPKIIHQKRDFTFR